MSKGGSQVISFWPPCPRSTWATKLEGSARQGRLPAGAQQRPVDRVWPFSCSHTGVGS